MKIYSWNVNGLRANLKRGTFMDFINAEQPDILCLQETKAKPGQVTVDLPNYLELWHSADRPGYSGTAIFTKFKPLGSINDLPADLAANYPWDDDKFGNPLKEGRLQTIEFEPFYLINMYVPNSKPNLSRLNLREHLWDPAILNYINILQKAKPVIICGDFNVAHTPHSISLVLKTTLTTPASLTKSAKASKITLPPVSLLIVFVTFTPVNKNTLGGHIGRMLANVISVGASTIFYFLKASFRTSKTQ